MSLEINKKGLSGNAIKVIEDATKRAEEKVETIFAKFGAKYEKNNTIDTDVEKNFFDIEIKSSTILTANEKKQILGESDVKEPSKAKQERQTKRADKKDAKDSQGVFNNTLETFVKDGMQRKDIAQALKTEFEPVANETYTALIQNVEKVLSDVKDKDFQNLSMEEVDAYFYKKIAKTKDQNEKKILKQVAQMVKNEKVNYAKNEIANRYAKKVKEAEEKGQKVTDEEIMDQILKELKIEGKYVIDDNYGEKDQNEYVTAYKAFNNSEIALQARILLANVINGKTNSEEIDGKKIHKEAKQWLKSQGLWDNNVRKANSHRFGRKLSDAEGLDRNVALNTIKSTQELKEVFGLNADEKIKTLMNAQVALTDELGRTITDKNGQPKMFNLITLREDGFYDLTNLSRYVRQQVGSDNTYNKHKHDTNNEHGYLERGLNGAMTGIAFDLSDKEIVNLVEALGYDKKGKAYNIVKGLFGATVGTLSLGTSAFAGAANLYNGYIDHPATVDDIILKLDIRKALGEKAEQVFKEAGFDVEISIDGYVETTLRDIVANDKIFLELAPSLIAQSTVKTALLGGVLGLLAGFQEYEEKPAIPLNVGQTNLKDYSDTLNSSTETKKYAKLLTSLALVKGFVTEDGTLDGEGFERYLRRIFAGNDILNKDELLTLEKEYLDSQEHRLLTEKKPVVETQSEPQDEEPVDTAVVEKVTRQRTVETVEDDYVVYNREAGDGWAGIINEYYPDLLAKYNGRMYDYWKNGKRVAKGAIGALKDALGAADPAVLKALRNGGDIPERLNLPKTIEGTSINPDAKQVKKVDIVSGGKTTLKEAGEKKQKVNVTYSPALDIYIAYDEAEPGIKSTGGTEEAAIAVLEHKSGKDFEEIKRLNYQK